MHAHTRFCVVPPDGNCLFEAVGVCLYGQRGQASRVRAEVAAFMLDNSERLAALHFASEEAFVACLEEVMTPARSSGGVVLEYIAVKFDLTVLVYEYDKGTGALCGQPYKVGESSLEVSLVHTEEPEHFDALLDEGCAHGLTFEEFEKHYKEAAARLAADRAASEALALSLSPVQVCLRALPKPELTWCQKPPVSAQVRSPTHWPQAPPPFTLLPAWASLPAQSPRLVEHTKTWWKELGKRNHSGFGPLLPDGAGRAGTRVRSGSFVRASLGSRASLAPTKPVAVAVPSAHSPPAHSSATLPSPRKPVAASLAFWTPSAFAALAEDDDVDSESDSDDVAPPPLPVARATSTRRSTAAPFRDGAPALTGARVRAAAASYVCARDAFAADWCAARTFLDLVVGNDAMLNALARAADDGALARDGRLRSLCEAWEHADPALLRVANGPSGPGDMANVMHMLNGFVGALGSALLAVGMRVRVLPVVAHVPTLPPPGCSVTFAVLFAGHWQLVPPNAPCMPHAGVVLLSHAAKEGEPDLTVYEEDTSLDGDGLGAGFAFDGLRAPRKIALKKAELEKFGAVVFDLSALKYKLLARRQARKLLLVTRPCVRFMACRTLSTGYAYPYSSDLASRVC